MNSRQNCLFSTAAGVLLLAALSTLEAAARGAGETRSGEQPETGLAFWEWRREGVSLKLVQRLPDQTRAFFLGRGFPREAADDIARNCVFQSIFRNEGQAPLDYDLREWRILHNGQTMPMRLQAEWDRKWSANQISEPARIAFRWSLLPPQQHFEPGDYNWGMLSFGLPPGELFDLELVVHIDGRTIEGRIPNIQCPTENTTLQGQP